MKESYKWLEGSTNSRAEDESTKKPARSWRSGRAFCAMPACLILDRLWTSELTPLASLPDSLDKEECYFPAFA